MALNSIFASRSEALAISNGEKTQLRRVIIPKVDPKGSYTFDPIGGVLHWSTVGDLDRIGSPDASKNWHTAVCPYRLNRKLLIRTAWAVDKSFDKISDSGLRIAEIGSKIWHAGQSSLPPDWAGRIRNGKTIPNDFIPYMPHTTVVAIAVERLQSITEEDAFAEGCSGPGQRICQFAAMWDLKTKIEWMQWDEDPWVWKLSLA
jgi:hypothetical protein